MISDEKPILPIASGPEAVQNAAPIRLVTKTRMIGSSGTENYSGYSSEEYLATLRGKQAADEFDKMRRSDAKVKMCLSAVMNPIRAASWEVVPGELDDQEMAKRHAAFVEHCLFKDLGRPWKKFLGEALSFLVFGHSVFELTDKVVFNHPKYGTYNGIGSLGFRSQRTIERWNLDPATGNLVSVTQYAYGDLDRKVDIPGEFLVVFSLDQEGDNYEGISALRACFGPWFRKNNYQKLIAIGIEKYAIPTPVATIPKNMHGSTEYDNLIEALEAWTGHEKAYLTKPDGWEIDFPLSNGFDASKVQPSVDAENKEIVFAFLANFLELGMSGGGGSYALGNDLSDFFLGGIEYMASLISETLDERTIKRLIDLNFGPQESYPTLKASGISDKAGEEFSKILQNLATSKYITPDDPTEDHLRKRIGLPPRSLEGQRDVSAPAYPQAQPSASAPVPMAESKPGVQFAEKSPRGLITQGSSDMRAIMQEGIRGIAEDLVGQVVSKAKSASSAQLPTLTKDIAVRGKAKYKAALFDAMSVLAARAETQARKEVPSKKWIKLSETQNYIRLSEFDSLPKKVQKKISATADLLAESQSADLEKAVFFQYQNSFDSTDSMDLIAKDLATAAEDYVTSSSVVAASGNTAAAIVNTARNAFFFEPEVAAEVDSFTFVNGDPVSPICQDLAGTTFDSNDPESGRYLPPLHFNCKSYIVPNLKGGRSREIDPTGLKPSNPDLEKFIQLSEHALCGH